MDSEPRILHIEVTDEFGGIEMFLLSVYKNIDRTKLQFDFVSSKEKIAIENRLIELGGRIFRIKYGNVLSYYRKLVKLIVENGYTVVHIHKNSAANIIPFIACKKAGVKTIIAHSHNTSPSKGRITKVLHYINRPILNALSSEKFACSDLAAIWLFGKGYVGRNEIRYIKNGIEIEQFEYDTEIRKRIRKKLNLHNNTFLLGSVGRMTRQKNQIFLVDILFEIRKWHADTKLLICGDGDMRDKIRKRAEDLGVGDGLIMPGRCSNVNEMLQAMDIYVMPSLYEGLTVAAVEAQCAGLPIILSDTLSKETKIVDNCQYVSLSAPAKEWAMKIMEYRKIKREEAGVKIREAGFDVKNTALFLQEYYIEKL